MRQQVPVRGAALGAASLAVGVAADGPVAADDAGPGDVGENGVEIITPGGAESPGVGVLESLLEGEDGDVGDAWARGHALAPAPGAA